MDRPPERSPEVGGPDPHRSFPRLRGLLGGAGQGEDRRQGRWVPAPGVAFFEALQQRFTDLPLIAEDLGVITPAVEALRDDSGSRDASPPVRLQHQPRGGEVSAPQVRAPLRGLHGHARQRHLTWLADFQARPDHAVRSSRSRPSGPMLCAILAARGEEFHWDMIRLAFGSVADIAIIPMQDVLGLDSSARMNVPGKAEGNWGWRFALDQLTAEVKHQSGRATAIYGRWNGTIPPRTRSASRGEEPGDRDCTEGIRSEAANSSRLGSNDGRESRSG